MTSISDKKTAITGAMLVQVKQWAKMAGRENMNSCMATVENNDQDACSGFNDQDACEDNQCSWQVLYSYSGGKITVMLQNLYEQFEDEKHEHKKQCDSMERAHNLSESAKAAALENMEAQMSNLKTAFEKADE